MRIPMVFEPTFARDSIWCTEIKRGMTRVMHVQKYEALRIPGEHYRTYDYEALFAPGGARLRELSAYPFPFLLLDFARLGEQAVRLFRYLYTENDPAVHTFLRLDGSLVDPTGGAPVCHPAEGEGAPAAVPVPDGDFYHDEEVRLLSCLGRFLSGCDALDYRILGAVLGGSSYEQAAEDLHTARNTVVYRMRRLWTSLGFHSGRELIVYLRIHQLEEILTGNPQKTREDGKTEGNP